jgi:ataxia telangiectasia mutated family protein
VKLLDPLNQVQRRAAKMVYYQYASFANEQLRQMEASEEYKRQKEWSDNVKAEIKELDRGISVTRSQSEKEDLRRRREKSERFLEADQKNLKEHEAAVKSFLQQAISMYAHYMEASNTLDQEIAVRFCGLWFAHFDSEIAAESIKHALPKISSHKLLFLSHQLTARLGSSKDSEKRSQQFLKQVVEAMCSNHPFHSLFQVMTMRGLAPSPKDARTENNSVDSSTKRRDEAKRIIEIVRLKIKDGALARPDRFMELMEESFKAYVEWAQYPIKELNPKNGIFYSIPKNIALFKWSWDGRSKVNKPQRLCIPVITADIPIEMDGKYLDIPTIHWYERRYTVAGGVHVPKINLCVDTLGRQHRQLVSDIDFPSSYHLSQSEFQFKGEGGQLRLQHHPTAYPCNVMLTFRPHRRR